MSFRTSVEYISDNIKNNKYLPQGEDKPTPLHPRHKGVWCNRPLGTLSDSEFANFKQECKGWQLTVHSVSDHNLARSEEAHRLKRQFFNDCADCFDVVGNPNLHHLECTVLRLSSASTFFEWFEMYRTLVLLIRRND